MNCLVCGKAFPPRAQQLYCSVRCRQRASNQRDYQRHRETRIVQERARRALKRKPRSTLIERLAAWSIPEPNSGCRLWLGAISAGGYPIIRVKDKNLYAHRVAYEQHKGPIPQDLDVMHNCDTPSCIEPNHLVLGTDALNAAHRLARGKGLPGTRN